MVCPLKHGIAPDGSCLFSAIDFLCTGKLDDNAPTELRSHCAGEILKQPEKYDELYLGKIPEEYCTWIQSPHSYGGEVEIIILAQLKQVEITVVSSKSLVVLTYTPELYHDETKRGQRIYILYNGQHYDAIVGGAEREGQEPCRIFGTDTETENAVLNLATDEKKARDFALRTRQRRRIKCECGTVVEDSAAFQTHCSEVEHDDDFCYSCEEIIVEEQVENENDE